MMIKTKNQMILITKMYSLMIAQKNMNIHAGPYAGFLKGGVTKLVINTYFTLIMVKNHIITN